MNDLILAIDTTREFGSLALVRDGELVEEVLMHAPDGFGSVLYAQLRRFPIKEIACFAAAAGPGSFTGVRVGLACVKGLAEATGKKVVVVSNLEALAWFGGSGLRTPILDARRGEVYCALYDVSGTARIPESVMKFPAWLECLPQDQIEFISTDFAPFQTAISGTRFAASKITTAPRALAGAIARIAHARFIAGLAQDPAEIDANYVR